MYFPGVFPFPHLGTNKDTNHSLIRQYLQVLISLFLRPIRQYTIHMFAPRGAIESIF